jgi:Cdc6-like AAA superfamily ATPase
VFADVLTALSVLVALLAPVLIRLLWALLMRIRPQPGTGAFADDDLPLLRRAFDVDRASIAVSMVPGHAPEAQPASSARKVDFGDAALVVPSESLKELADFVGRPPSRGAQLNSTLRWEKEILLVTGEPGAGKSVLFQELYSSLSGGVEKGNHSLVPLILFARDLSIPRLERAARAANPLQALLLDYYTSRVASSPAGEDLRRIISLISNNWDKTDCIVLIDGLDEIAQRSAYEVIQRKLSAFIQQDLTTLSARRVHRYLLSCRVDEDLKLFPGAASLFLRGLSERQRDRFCQTLIDRQGLDRRTRIALEEVLKSKRVSPTHVFRRNPYFLALLLRHLREDEERVREQTLNFDFLMRRFLEREVVRPHAAADEKGDLPVAARRLLFDEFECVSRPILQFLAFRSAAAGSTPTLYDEITIGAGLLSDFQAAVGSSQENEAGLWASLRLLKDRALDGAKLADEELVRLDLSRHFRENDVRTLLSQMGSFGQSGLTKQVILGTLGALPYQQVIEQPDWYAELAARLAKLDGGPVSPSLAFSTLLFTRSLGAAHVLRVLNVTLTNEAITLRFRHRRLAEYYAACFLRERWPSLARKLPFSPWLSPVFNLSCALDGPHCQTFHWLIDKVINSPRVPAFSWRYVVEAAVESSFFAHPGVEFRRAVERLAGEVTLTLSRSTQGALDAVSELILLRALQQLAELKQVLGDGVLLTETQVADFYVYQSSRPAEWIAPILPARIAVQSLANYHPSLANKLKLVGRLVQQPSSVLFSGFPAPVNGLLPERLTVLAAVLTGEAAVASLPTLLIVGSFYALAIKISADSEAIFQAAKGLAAVVLGSMILLRLLAWQRSPTKAAAASSVLWRLPSLIRRWTSRGSNQRPDWLGSVFRSTTTWFASLAIAASAIAFAYYLALPATPDAAEPEPCPEIGHIRKEIQERFQDLPLASSVDWTRVRQELRSSLAQLSEANRERRCGWKKEDGWQLAEEQVADRLAELDPRLVPSPHPGQLPLLGSSEASQLEEILAAGRVKEPPPGVVGSMAAFQLSRSEGATIRRLADFKARILGDRREGFGLPKGAADRTSAESIAFATITLTRIEEALIARRADLEALKGRTSQGLLWVSALAFASGGLLLLARAGLARLKDRRTQARIDHLEDIVELCEHLLASHHSEQVRLGVLSRIDRLKVVSPGELERLEATAGKLLRSGDPVERRLGIRTAEQAQVISNRLRHQS